MTTDNYLFTNNLSAKIYDIKSVLEGEKKEQKRRKKKQDNKKDRKKR